MTETPRSGRRVLVVEDEAIISLALADTLEGAGYTVAGPFGTRSETLNWLEGNTPDLALLDVKLKDGSSDDIARELVQRGVPFVVQSGHHPQRQAAPELLQAPWLEKPTPQADLLELLGSLKAA
jgi:DNA-binding response OmpR family regulator